MSSRPGSTSATVTTSAPAFRKARQAASGASMPTNTTQGAPCRIFAAGDIDAFASHTNFTGSFQSPGSRTFICGSSAFTVPTPVKIPCEYARSNRPSSRLASDVIHRLSPFSSAVRPSRLAASFIRTQGVPRFMRVRNPMLDSTASASQTPDTTSLSILSPRPATKGFGSFTAATTRPTLSLMSRSAQGGVRP